MLLQGTKTYFHVPILLALLQYLLISFDIADIATRNLNRRLQKRLAIMRYVIANLFCIFGEYQSQYIDNILR